MSLLNAYGLCRAVGDAEVSTVGSNGTSLCKFSVAFNRSYLVGKDWKQETTFIDVVAWGRMAESLGVVQRGQELFLKGRIDQSSWTNSEGEKRSRLQLYVTEFALVKSKQKSIDQESSNTNRSVTKNRSNSPYQDPVPQLEDSQIPF